MNKTGIRIVWSLSIVLLALVELGISSRVASSQDRDLTGRVGTLPGTENDLRAQGDLLEGHLSLLATSMDKAIEDLRHVELKTFAKSYKRMVEAYNQLSDHIGDAAVAIGDAEIQIELAKQNLDAAQQTPSVDSSARRKLGEDIGQVRALLIGKLAATRARYEQAVDDEEKTKSLHQMHGLVSRVRQLDGLSRSIATGTRPILPGLAAEQMREHLEVIEQTLQEEEKMLGVVAESVRLLVANTTLEMLRTVRLLEVEASIPREQLVELTQSRAAAQRALDQLAQAHKEAADAGERFIPSEPLEPLPAADQLLREADRLLESR